MEVSALSRQLLCFNYIVIIISQCGWMLKQQDTRKVTAAEVDSSYIPGRR